VQAHREYLTGETLALTLALGAGAVDGATALDADALDYSERTSVDGLDLQLALSRARDVTPA
jgi:hypothetical protein